MIEFKGLREALSLKDVRHELVKILKETAVWSARAGYNVRCTSLNDHTHTSKASKHYQDLAVDLVISYKNGKPHHPAMSRLAQFLKSRLDYGYDVVHDVTGHRNHIHVEWDTNTRPRKN